MNDDQPTPLERRLRREAQLLLERYPPPAFDARPLQVSRRRWRRLLMATPAAAALLIMIGLGVWRVFYHAGDSVAPVADVPSGQLPANNAGSQPSPQMVISPAQTETAAAPWVIPFVLETPSGETSLIGAGIFYPDEVQEISWEDLSPSEQEAVRRVLGDDAPVSISNPI